MENEQKDPLSFTDGEKWVGLDFNPSKDADVNEIKKHAAAIIDILTRRKQMNSTYIGNSLHGEAIRATKTATMWAVGYLTNKH